MLLPLSTSSSTNSEWTFITNQPSLMAVVWAAAAIGSPSVSAVTTATANVPIERLRYDIPFLLTASIVRRADGNARTRPAATAEFDIIRAALKTLERVGGAIAFIIAAWFWLTYFNRNTNLLDEGSTAAQALRIINGDLIYRDFFTVVTPGSYYTVAWLLRIFGEQLMVLRWAALVTGLGIFVVSYYIARRISSWPFAAAAAMMT